MCFLSFLKKMYQWLFLVCFRQQHLVPNSISIQKTLKKKKNTPLYRFPCKITVVRKPVTFKMTKNGCIPVYVNNTSAHEILKEHFPQGMSGHAQLFKTPQHISSKKKIFLEVFEVLFQKEDLLVLKCKWTNPAVFKVKTQVVTLKMKSFAADIHEEYLHFKELKECQLDVWFPEIYFFATFQSKEHSNCWGCIAMEFFHLSLVDLFYVEKHLTKKNLYNILLQNFELDHSHVSLDSRGNGMHVCTNKESKKDLLTSLLVTALQLLRTLHKAHWIHGDSHLGNFMINVCTLKVVMIDAERSFQTTSTVLKMSDAQELFAHAVRLSVETPYNGKWNMKDLTGVATILHPLFNTRLVPHTCLTTATQPAESLTHLNLKQKIIDDFHAKCTVSNVNHMFIFFLLPVCNCFVRHENSDRIHGCIFCKSKMHLTASALCQQEAIWKSTLNSMFFLSFIDLRQTVMDARILQRAIHDTGFQIIQRNKTWIWKSVKQCILNGEISFTVLDGDPPLDWATASFQRIYYFPMFQEQNLDFSCHIIQNISHNSQKSEADFLASYAQQRQLVDSNAALFNAWQHHLSCHQSLDSFSTSSFLLPPPDVHGAS
jgi:hypothetical protein